MRNKNSDALPKTKPQTLEWFAELQKCVPASFVAPSLSFTSQRILNITAQNRIFSLYAVALRFPRDFQPLYVPLYGANSRQDHLLCIAHTLGKPIWAQARAISERILAEGYTHIVLDGVDKGIFESIRILEVFLPSIYWILLSDVPLQTDAVVLHTPNQPDVPKEPLSKRYFFFAFLPAGLSIHSGLSEGFRYPTADKRIVLNPDFAAQIRGQTTPKEHITQLSKILAEYLCIAEGSPVPSTIDVPSLFALRWIMQSTQHSQLALRSSLVCANLYMLWGQLDRTFDILEEALHRERDPPLRQKIMLFWLLGYAHLQVGDWHKMNQYYQRAIAIAQDGHDYSGTLFLLRRYGEISLEWGRTQSIETTLHSALQIAQQIQDEASEASVLRLMAELSMLQGERVGAKVLLGQAKRLKHTPIEEANLYISQARLQRILCEPAKAKMFLHEAEKLAIYIPSLKANRLRIHAECAFLEENHAQAESFLQRALMIYKAAGHRLAQGSTHRQLADILLSQSRLKEARKHYQMALTIQLEIGDTQGISKTLQHLSACIESAHPQEAIFLRDLQRRLHE